MKTTSLFNNKGGVGKSTLAYHLGYALNEINKKTLMIDLDPFRMTTKHVIAAKRVNFYLKTQHNKF